MKKRTGKNFFIYVLLFALVISLAVHYKGVIDSDVEVKEVPLSTFVTYLQGEEFTEVNITNTKLTGKISDKKIVYCYANSVVELNIINDKYIFPQIEAGKLKYSSDAPKTTATTILSLLPTLFAGAAIIFLIYFMMNQGGNGKAFQFGKSRAKMVKGDKKVTFDDVAGLEEEKAELEEVVEFLRDPRKFNDLGARIPKGILLVGPPGTGKTYISKAAAGEADVPFFTISGSDFVEMFVGVGASRVRDLFDQAKKNSPCIVFIDEIDAVGRKRGSGIGGGHDEREQTLNQLLVEMDGFEENSGIIVLAATNRPDVLDPALLRPGRFDRQIVIGLPDVKGREAIIKVHAKNKPLADDVTPEILARRTMGSTPADLENILNEAALITARRNGRYIRMEEIEEAIRKVEMGPAKKSKVVSDEEKKLTAYHEAGHAIVARSLPKHMPIHEITIIPRGRAGGYTMYLPEDDRLFETKTEMVNHIITCMGGRAAETVKLNDISVGASGDIKQATEIAREMVTKYGFSEVLGNVNYGGDGEVFLGNDFAQHKTYSEETAKEIDEEIRKIITDASNKAEEVLREKEDILEEVAKALLLVETLDGEQFEALYNKETTAEELSAKVVEQQEEKAKKDLEEAEETLRRRKEEEELLAKDPFDYEEDEEDLEDDEESRDFEEEKFDEPDNSEEVEEEDSKKEE